MEKTLCRERFQKGQDLMKAGFVDPAAFGLPVRGLICQSPKDWFATRLVSLPRLSSLMRASASTCTGTILQFCPAKKSTVTTHPQQCREDNHGRWNFWHRMGLLCGKRQLGCIAGFACEWPFDQCHRRRSTSSITCCSQLLWHIWPKLYKAKLHECKGAFKHRNSILKECRGIRFKETPFPNWILRRWKPSFQPSVPTST